jgi:hypothetical protein
MFTIADLVLLAQLAGQLVQACQMQGREPTQQEIATLYQAARLNRLADAALASALQQHQQ